MKLLFFSETPSLDSKNASRLTLRQGRNLRTSSQLSNFSTADSLTEEEEKAMTKMLNELRAIKEDEELPPK